MPGQDPESYLEMRHDRNSSAVTGAYYRERNIKDVIYGFIELPAYCWLWIDTREMQRLKTIYQLGPNVMVYPGATHNRFEHSCGVAYLCVQ